MSLNYTTLRHKIAERGFWVGQAAALAGCLLLAALNISIGAEWPQWIIYAGVATSVSASVLGALTRPEPRRSAQYGEPQ